MARKGRELEILIEKLERCTLPEGATIKSPGFIPDKITGQAREVDILIEYKLGTVPILVIIECRDRKSAQDTQWIEQIAAKTNDLNVNKVIAVSSSRFTEPAMAKAKHYGIETRMLEEVDIASISEWWKVFPLEIVRTEFVILSATVICEQADLIKDMLKIITPNDKLFSRAEDDKAFSLNDICSANVSTIDLREKLIPNGPNLTIGLNLDFSNQENYILNKSTNSKFKILQIQITVDLKLIQERIPTSRIQYYRDTADVISEIVEFDDVQLGGIDVLQFIRNPNGSISLSARKG